VLVITARPGLELIPTSACQDPRVEARFVAIDDAKSSRLHASLRLQPGSNEMTDVKYEEGVFCWVDLSTHDMAAAGRWYSELFGWEISPSGGDMPYSMATLGGKMVAGIGEMSDEMKKMGHPPTWNNYAWTEDCAKAETMARELGGEVLVPTMQVGEFGSMAFIKDSTGAVFGLWQPGLHRGAQAFGEPHTTCWYELMTKDVAKAKDFYGKVLGWGYQAMPMGDFEYTMIKVGERDNGGIMGMDGPMWEGVPPHWMIYFAVTDTDAICRKIEATGGKVCVPPSDIPGVGRFAVVNDPQGATFSVLRLNPPEG
jgi:predicted enzyme related to lactoylglutathione lyase